MSPKNHRQGGKMGGRHTTVIDAAQLVIDLAQRMPDVTKIVAGYITSGVKGGKQRIKIKKITGGLLVVVRGSVSIQELRIYSDNIEETQRKLEQEFL